MENYGTMEKTYGTKITIINYNKLYLQQYFFVWGEKYVSVFLIYHFIIEKVPNINGYK